MDDAPIRPDGTRTSYRPFAGATDALVELDTLLVDIERATGGPPDHRPIVRLPSGRAVIVEPGAPYTTLSVTPDDIDAASTIRPLIDLSEFWRVWRPPAALVDPRDRAWLARHDLDRDPAPPLPARWDERRGWRDVPAGRLGDLVADVRTAAERIAKRDARRKKGAA